MATEVRTWSPQQAAAIDAVARWYRERSKQVFRVFGYAGTGKTTLARHFAEGLKGRVLYMAYTGKAAMVMRKNGCVGALTIHATIYSVDFNPETGVRKFVLKDVDELSDAALFIVDECSMVDQDIGRDMLSFGVPILVLGDPAQLPPVKGGGFFTDADPDVMLTEIHRQASENPIVQMATTIREGGRLAYGTYGESRVITRADLTQDDVMLAGQPHCMPCDTYDRVADNIAAIAKHIEATRAIDRFGVASVREMFTGFQALPAPGAKRPWREVLMFGQDMLRPNRDMVEKRYRELAKERHPDAGGSADAMAQLNAAKAEALKDIG